MGDALVGAEVRKKFQGAWYTGIVQSFSAVTGCAAAARGVRPLARRMCIRCRLPPALTATPAPRSWYRVVYEDNDQEDLIEKALRPILVGASPLPKVRFRSCRQRMQRGGGNAHAARPGGCTHCHALRGWRAAARGAVRASPGRVQQALPCAPRAVRALRVPTLMQPHRMSPRCLAAGQAAA